MNGNSLATWVAFEWRLVVRARLSLAALLLLLLLSAVSVWSGLQETARQRATIARLAGLQAQDAAVATQRNATGGDAGNAAYYTYHHTWDAPQDAAFLALGLRDVAPYALRIRALGLQAQLYEGESFNPEVALPGRFDFAFVLIYLSPLFVIALLHDLVSGERQSGRLRMLAAMPDGARLWRRRVALRFALLLGCLALPLLAGALWSGLGAGATVLVLAVSASYLAFWIGVSLLVGARGRGSVTNATVLMGTWAVLTLVLPTLANLALTRAIPVHQGVDLVLAQRQTVHGAWEVPREDTMRKFYQGHPQWRNSAPLTPGFQWKWYYAFHQLGDESVAGQVAHYRAGLLARQDWTDRLGWLLPGVGVQAVLHRLANTDLPAQLAYQQRIASFHQALRHFYYGYLFTDKPFGPADAARQPVFAPASGKVALPWQAAGVVCVVASLMLAAGVRSLRRLSRPARLAGGGSAR